MLRSTVLVRHAIRLAGFAALLAAAGTRAESGKALLLGRVADEQGQPIPDAELFVRGVYSGDEGPRTYWKSERDVVVCSGADGRFSVPAAVGEQRLSVFADGYAPMHRTHRAYEGQNPGWDFTLVKSARVSCKILDTHGRPQHPRFLHVTPADPYTRPPPAPGMGFYWHAMTFEGTSAPDGSFELRHLSPGRYDVLVTSPWLQAKKEGNGLVQIPVSGGRFEVAAGQTIANFEIRVRPPEDFVVAGRVRRADGTPMTNVSVSTGSFAGGGARTDSRGAFRIEGLDCLGADRFPLQFDYKLTLPDVALNATNLDVVWPGSGTIEGRVFDAATGSNLAAFAAAVSKVQLNDSPAFFENLRLQTEMPPDGRFRISGVPEGVASLVVSNAVLGARQFSVAVKAGQTAEVECPMVGPAMLEGQLTFNGKPHPGHVVIDGQWIYSGNDGRYRFATAPDGRRVVWFFNHEYSHRFAEVDLVAGQTVHLDMELGGPCAIKGAIRFPDGVDHCNIRLAEIPPAGGWSGGRPWPPERVLAIAHVKAEESKFALNHLPAGRFHLTVGVASGFQYLPAWTREIELKEGEPLSLDVDLAAPPHAPAP